MQLPTPNRWGRHATNSLLKLSPVEPWKHVLSVTSYGTACLRDMDGSNPVGLPENSEDLAFVKVLGPGYGWDQVTMFD